MDTENTKIKDAGTLFSSFRLKKTDTNMRRVLIKELYEIYSSVTQEKLRKVENWKRYRLWCIFNKCPNTPANQKKFKKSIRYLKKMDDRTFAIRLAHIKTDELWEIRSLAADRDHRGHSVGGWLFAKNDSTLHTEG